MCAACVPDFRIALFKCIVLNVVYDEAKLAKECFALLSTSITMSQAHKRA